MDALAAAGRAIGRDLTPVEELKRNDRAQVLRARADGGPVTVIVKTYATGYAERWARESAALTVLRGRGLPVPELLAVADDPMLVVLADAGRGGSLADAFLGRDAAAADGTLGSWADALASLHSATAGDAALFATALGAARVAGSGEGPAADPMPGLLGTAADLLATHLPALGVTPGGRALARLRSMADELSPDATALTPADACPDNNLATPSGLLLLLDFEQAAFRHVAWDAAYLLVPWPTCWCSWGLPDVAAGAALARWRGAVAPSIPAAAAPAFERDLDIAVVAWSLLSGAFFLAGVLDRDDTPGGPAFSPSRRTVIRHRMALAARRRAAAPDLADLAEEVLTATARHWGELPLAMAPAYR
ncbi:phosphotransferase [Dactylosporangium aurantiacum]|uniref:Phosphotransferase n=1 Tax=Dactylosporangium aurantiacum TaxID=35754 RepID=A0A9Q9MLV8_9ACTN|nr:phosphotransferase [Dactylosporangium aurantiacum]MDG6107841.1 phosphotransferase [Dactylosporangium aurantiacum]UWZ57386.1 phosphotransferase [Dactylosporangium aurantiacum]